jgi:hypothetical protein
MDPGCSQFWVFLAHPSDEITHGTIDLWPVCTENLVRIDLMRESLNVGHDGRADISLRAGLYKDRANKANVKIGRENAILPLHESGQRKCHITST